ncbi:MAG TPA: hypothetical protein VGD83_14195 [Streptosporangiaceae bacterium]
MATYYGVPYHAGLGPDGNEATLFSPGPPPDELGFTPVGGHWRKQVSLTDLGALWQSRLVGEYRGEPCLVLDDLGDRLHIAYQGRDSARARQLGYWEIDREVFEVVVARQEVAGLTEERVEYPLDAAMFPASNRDPAAQMRPEAPARGPGGAPPSAAERTSPLRAVTEPGPQPPPASGPGRPSSTPDRSSSTPDRMAAWHGSPDGEPWPGPRPDSRMDPASDPRRDPRSDPRFDPRSDPRTQARPDRRDPGDHGDPRDSRGDRPPGSGPRGAASPTPPPASPGGRRAGRRDRVPQSVFAELLSLAAIPHAAYVVDEEIPGAMCLVKADGGFEVFSRTDDARLDVRFFEDEEAAYFYLFGVLAAEAVRSGRLRPGPFNGHVNGSHGPGVPAGPATENVSEYLRSKKLPKSAPGAVMVN